MLYICVRSLSERLGGRREAKERPVGIQTSLTCHGTTEPKDKTSSASRTLFTVLLKQRIFHASESWSTVEYGAVSDGES